MLRSRSSDRSILNEKQEGLGRRAARGAAFTMSSSIVRFILATARTVVLARLLSPADYGIVGMVAAITGFLQIFQDLGLNVATVTRESLNHAQVSALFWVNLSVGLGLSVATAAASPLIAWLYDESRLVGIALALSPNFFLAGLAVQHQALMRRQMRFGALSLIQISNLAIGLCLGIGVAWCGGGYWALVAMTCASSIANCISVWVCNDWRPGPPARGGGARDMLYFGSQVTATNIVNYLSRRLDHFVIGWWFGPSALGLYVKSSSLVEMPSSTILNPVASVALPGFSRLTNDETRYREAFLRVLGLLCLLAMPSAAFMIGSARWLIPFLLGPQWGEAAPIFGTLAILGFTQPVETTHWWLLITQDRAREGFRWSMFAALLSICAIVLGAPFGPFGVAAALATSGLLRLPVLVWYATRVGPVRALDVARVLAVPALASLCALLVLVLAAPVAEGMGSLSVLCAGLLLTAVTAGIALGSMPLGRALLREAWRTIRLLDPRQRLMG